MFPLKIIDISMAIHPAMPVYKNRDENRPLLQITRDFLNSSARESEITMNLHTGTHLDTSLHFVPDGAAVEELSLDRVVTPCTVLDMTHVNDAVTASDLERHSIKPGDFVLLKTRNSFTEAFDFHFVFLREDGAKWLQQAGVKGVGIDALGIERDQPEHGTHKTLLRAGIVILEGLRLGHVEPGAYLLSAAPLQIKGAEAAPVRALLIQDAPKIE